MKTKILSLFAFLVSLNIFAQTVPCEKIERTVIPWNRGSEKNAFKVGNMEGQRFGIFYNKMKPYVWCTQEAVPEFKKGVKFCYLKTGALIAGAIGSYIGGSLTSSSGKTQVGPLAITGAIFISSIPLYILQRKHIKKSIEKHNSTLH